VRRICEEGLVEAKQTSSGQWLIPDSEIERVIQEGVPPIPSAISAEEENVHPRHFPDSLLAPPSNKAIASAEEVLVRENLLKKLRVENEIDDLKEDRTNRKARRKASEQAALEQRAAEERAAAARAQAQHEYLRWRDHWLGCALSRVPSDASPSLKLDVNQYVGRVLDGLQAGQTIAIVQPLVDAAVDKALRPWRQGKESAKALEKACDSLSWLAKSLSSPTEWQIRARDDAKTAIDKLPPDASFMDKLQVTQVAVKRIDQEFQHSESCERVVNGICVLGATEEERERAEQAVCTALGKRPIGSSLRDLEKARDLALAPLERAIDERRRKTARKEHVDLALVHIETYLRLLESQGEIEQFDDSSERKAFAEELEEPIRQHLLRRLAHKELTQEEIEAIIEDMVDRKIDF
jgi:hypothetical protein